MLDEKDLKDIAHLMNVIIENDVTPKFDLLAEGQQTILETLAPKSKVEVLEEEVAFLRSVIASHSREIQELKKAQ